MAGQPTKYSEELAESICSAIAKGMPETHAAIAADICRRTLARWKKENVAFCHAIKRARAQAMQVRVERIEKAAKGGEEYEVTETIHKAKNGAVTKTTTRKKSLPTWTADAWYLERQFCEEFGLNKLDLKELIKLLRETKAMRAGEKK